MSSKFKLLIVEDEPLTAETIREYLLQLDSVDVLMEHEKDSALGRIERESFDLILLDIRMKGKYDGIEIGEELSRKKIPFIYITAHSDLDMIQKMTETRANSFISKPIRKEELLLNISFALNSIAEKKNKIITVRSGYDLIPIEKEKFLYLKAEGNYLEIFLMSGESIVVRSTMEGFLKDVMDEDLIQVHRSFVVNRNKVKKLKSAAAYLINNQLVPVSRTFVSQVRTSLSKN